MMKFTTISKIFYVESKETIGIFGFLTQKHSISKNELFKWSIGNEDIIDFKIKFFRIFLMLATEIVKKISFDRACRFLSD